MTTAESLISALAMRIDEALGAAAAVCPAFALVDFPDHQNVGDNAIWLGETRWLEQRGFPAPAYLCTIYDYSAEALRSAVPEGPIFLHGGGNFGDLWPAHQRLREQVCLDFPDRRIIQFPQSVCFESREAFERARSVVGGHPDFHLFVRDRAGLEMVKGFGCHVGLCPDMAFVLGPQDRGADIAHPLLALMRRDKEAVHRSDELMSLLATAEVRDWQTSEPIHAAWSPSDPPEHRFPVCQVAARQRVARGLNLLGQGERIVTDRLHGHILCLLMNLPHLVVDNSYGKLSNFVSCWTAAAPGVQLAFGSPPENPGTGRHDLGPSEQ